jgi:hypothetical protein
MRPVFTFIWVALSLAGCAARFGYKNVQTSIDVQTVPPLLPYYIIDYDKARTILEPSAKGWQIKSVSDFDAYLETLLAGLTSNTSPIQYQVGTYVLAVGCPRGFEFVTFTAINRERNSVSFSCT